MRIRQWFGSVLLLGSLLGTGGGLFAWKQNSIAGSAAAAASQPEWAETVTTVAAAPRASRRMTTAIGTVRALRSITVQNELAGTVREVALVPGAIVEAGAVLVTLDVAVELAELQAQRAQVALAETLLQRMQRAAQTRAASELDVDRARAERDVALAQIARTEAIIAQKTIRAPFRARVGLADVHPGQYLHAGTELTTLQGMDDAIHIEFHVAQAVAAELRPGSSVEVVASDRAATTVTAEIVAIDARFDANTRNAIVRARVGDGQQLPGPGASVRVRVPVGPALAGVGVPASALRRGPSGDHVFTIEPDADGNPRAQVRPVRIGEVANDEVLIRDGLAAGELVAVTGSFKLRPGVLVMTAEGAGKP